MSLKKTAEGHEYEVGDGISHGLPCDGAITPASNMAQGASKTFDAIIIGAGFTGLTAARDLTLAGKSLGKERSLPDHGANILRQVARSFYSKGGTASEAEHGHQTSMAISTKWGEPGFTGNSPTSIARWLATISIAIS